MTLKERVNRILKKATHRVRVNKSQLMTMKTMGMKRVALSKEYKISKHNQIMLSQSKMPKMIEVLTKNLMRVKSKEQLMRTHILLKNMFMSLKLIQNSKMMTTLIQRCQ
jgi:hypothetical protein